MPRVIQIIAIPPAVAGWIVTIFGATPHGTECLSLGLGRLGLLLAALGTVPLLITVLLRPAAEIYAAGKMAGYAECERRRAEVRKVLTLNGGRRG